MTGSSPPAHPGPWALITVTRDGAVHVARGFPTIAMAEDAKSLALTGMTVADLARSQRLAQEYMAAAAADWRAAHPPRRPTEAESADLPRSGIFASSQPHSTIGDDGLVYDWPGSAGCGFVFAAPTPASAIQSAAIVPDPPAEQATIGGPPATPDGGAPSTAQALRDQGRLATARRPSPDADPADPEETPGSRP